MANTMRPSANGPDSTLPPFEVADFNEIPPVDCPCGKARRAFYDVSDWPMTLHVTEISTDAKLHYHKKMTETYYILECDSDARMQLNDEIVPLKQGVSVLIRPMTRHRAIGKMKVLIVVHPKFDPADEYVEEN